MRSWKPPCRAKFDRTNAAADGTNPLRPCNRNDASGKTAAAPCGHQSLSFDSQYKTFYKRAAVASEKSRFFNAAWVLSRFPPNCTNEINNLFCPPVEDNGRWLPQSYQGAGNAIYF